MVVGDGRPVSIAWADGRCDFQGRCAERQSSLAPGWRRVVEAWRGDARLSGQRQTPNTGAAGGLENHERHSHLFPRGCDRHSTVLTRAVSLSQRALVDFE